VKDEVPHPTKLVAIVLCYKLWFALQEARVYKILYLLLAEIPEYNALIST
jgi:hypothetical protein